MGTEELNGIEKFFCDSWEGWDLLDTGVFYFYDPVVKEELKKAVPFEISGMVVDTGNAFIEFYDDAEKDPKTKKFNITSIVLKEA